MLPKLLFSQLPWTVNGYVNFARDLYHLLAMGTTPWTRSCRSSRDKGETTRGISSGRANPCSVSGCV